MLRIARNAYRWSAGMSCQIGPSTCAALTCVVRHDGILPGGQPLKPPVETRLEDEPLRPSPTLRSLLEVNNILRGVETLQQYAKLPVNEKETVPAPIRSLLDAEAEAERLLSQYVDAAIARKQPVRELRRLTNRHAFGMLGKNRLSALRQRIACEGEPPSADCHRCAAAREVAVPRRIGNKVAARVS